MIQLLIELSVPASRVDDLLQGFEAVMLPARLDRRCRSASIWRSPEGSRLLRYQEEWLDPVVFEREARGERVGRLLALVDFSDQPPLIEVRTITEVWGLEYFEAVRGASPHDEHGPPLFSNRSA